MSSPISLYIPHVFANIDCERITNIFEVLALGKVSRIDMISKMNKSGVAYNSVYIHFETWYNTLAAANFQDRVRDPAKEARLVYDEPWYWIVLENKGTRREPGDRKLCIDIAPGLVFDENEDQDFMEMCEEIAADDDNMSEISDELNNAFIQEEELAEPCFNLVDAEYTAKLEHELHSVRRHMAKLEHEYKALSSDFDNTDNENTALKHRVKRNRVTIDELTRKNMMAEEELEKMHLALIKADCDYTRLHMSKQVLLKMLQAKQEPLEDGEESDSSMPSLVSDASSTTCSEEKMSRIYMSAELCGNN